VLLSAGVVGLGGCERPPIDTQQTGYRGTGIVEVANPRLAEPAEEIPSPLPAATPDGPKAGDVYRNVQVLDDLSVAEFGRLMSAMTAWVSPEEGCNYCHVGNDLASDDVYTKVVSRRMIEMTRYINDSHASHVGETGVSCFTCHRGKNVPAELWTVDPGPRSVQGMAGWRAGQNIAAESTAYSSLPYDPFQRYLKAPDDGGIRVISATALPTGANPRDIKDTEWTYGLMMHISDSLGVNCTYCHNTRSFADWPGSQAVRVGAWYGLGMVQDVNQRFLAPLADTLPAHRQGPLGDAPKAHCGTCHQGAPRPLNGAPMLADYPELSGG